MGCICVFVWYYSQSWDAHIPIVPTLLVYRVATPCRWALRDGTVPSSVQRCFRRLESRPKRAKQMSAWQLAWEEPNTLNDDQLRNPVEWYTGLDPEEARDGVPVEEILDYNK